MKEVDKDKAIFWGVMSGVGAASGIISWLLGAPWWLITICTVVPPFILLYIALLIFASLINW